jgi:hypothetical protein
MGRGMKLADKRSRKVRMGRPPLRGGRESLNLTVPGYAKRWLLSRPLGASAQVLAWIDAHIAKEQADADDYDARTALRALAEQKTAK